MKSSLISSIIKTIVIEETPANRGYKLFTKKGTV
ncbi:Uncharacterised protein [Serratia marcescens]|nr:Uncharacterised protein [Serratia marcescens]